MQRSHLLFLFLASCLLSMLFALTAGAAQNPLGFSLMMPNGAAQQQPTTPAGAYAPVGDPRLLQPNAQGVQQIAPAYTLPGQGLYRPRNFTGSPAWAQQPYPLEQMEFPPFGANLFQGHFTGTYYEGLNETYAVTPGDRIQISIWGAHTYSEVLPVDQQGNLFLPEVGPVPVAGLSPKALQSAVRSYVASVFKSNVEVYVNLLTAQPVAVYVTGFVPKPGRYAGGMTDSVLYYLDRAGGVLPERGSYRNILVQRHNRTISRVDLYAFILQGRLPNGHLQDGDVIVVGPKGNSITAKGLIPQQASFEHKGSKGMTGGELISYAAPLPAASHVSVVGTRNAVPFHVYMSLQEFTKLTLLPEDKVEFLADKPGSSIMVTVSGAVSGATRYPITRKTTLRSLLAYVPVDAALSNLDGIYVKRRSVVEQQKKAIDDALFRLENSVLTATSLTREEAAIRVQEAGLVQKFVERVKQLTPDGVVVVTRKGRVADIILEDGDEIVIPQKSDIVQVVGEVMIPKAVVYNGKYNAAGYVADAGGFTDRADKSGILVVHANGEIEKADATKIQPGDLLMVLPRYDSKAYQIFKDVMQLLFQLAVTTKVVLTI